MRKTKAEWPVKELMARRQHRLLKGWLRHTKNLDRLEEMVQICEPEIGRILGEENKMGSVEDLKNCQEGREEIPYCQVGKDEHSRLSESLVESNVSSIQQGVLMKMGSVDLIVCQGSSREIPYCHMGRDEQVSWNQPEELTKKMSSEVHLDQ
jgi:hypothetical protein